MADVRSRRAHVRALVADRAEDRLLESFRIPVVATAVFILTMISVYLLAQKFMESYSSYGIGV